MKLSKSMRCYLIFSLSLLFLFVSNASAQNMQEIKARMLDRKTTIDALKDRGVVGEGVDGYLHFRKNLKDAKKVVNDENKDRRIVNQKIAKKEGTTVEKVSKKVAIKLIKVSKPGQWIKKGDGTWYKK